MVFCEAIIIFSLNFRPKEYKILQGKPFTSVFFNWKNIFELEYQSTWMWTISAHFVIPKGPNCTFCRGVSGWIFYCIFPILRLPLSNSCFVFSPLTLLQYVRDRGLYFFGSILLLLFNKAMTVFAFKQGRKLCLFYIFNGCNYPV